MAAAIRQTAQLLGMNDPERVVFLGDELRETVWLNEATPSALLRRRDELLGEGRLQAIVHVGVAGDSKVRLTLAETFDDPAHPEVHCLLTWPGEWAWISIPTEAMEHWLSYWHVSEEGEE